MTALKFKSPGLLGFQVIKYTLSIEEILSTIDPHIPNQQHIARVGIVFGVIGIDGDASVVYLNIVICHGGSVLETGVPIGRYFDGFITEIFELGPQRGAEEN
jgi:hypothetical protein